MFKDIVAIERIHVASDSDVVSRLQSAFKSWYCNDRFNILNKFSRVAWADLSADNTLHQWSEEIDFSSIMNERASQIIDSNPTKHIIALWSGGVDSTGYVCALLKNGANLSRLTVLASPDSAEEHPRFVRLLQSKGVNLKFISDTKMIDFLRNARNAVIVDGCCADFIFGGNTCLKYPDLYNEPWDSALKMLFNRKGIAFTSSELDEAMGLASLYQEALGVSCKQFCEFAFLFMFGHQWSYYPHFIDLKIAPSENCSNVVTFYDTVPFQAFAMQYFNHITEHNPYIDKRHYKYVLKKYIYDFDRDERYFLTKGKVHSFHAYIPREKTVVLTGDGVYTCIEGTDDDCKHKREVLRMCLKQ